MVLTIPHIEPCGGVVYGVYDVYHISLAFVNRSGCHIL